MIRCLDRGDANDYQQLRLHSLRECPEAFLTTYEIESTKSLQTIAQNLVPTNTRFTLGAFSAASSQQATALATLVGMVTLVRETAPKVLHKANLYAMYVEPSHRGQGVGRALILALLSRARTMHGLEQINLTVVSRNIGALRLYESVGFRTFGVEARAIRDDTGYLDENWMAIRL